MSAAETLVVLLSYVLLFFLSHGYLREQNLASKGAGEPEDEQTEASHSRENIMSK